MAPGVGDRDQKVRGPYTLNYVQLQIFQPPLVHSPGQLVVSPQGRLHSESSLYSSDTLTPPLPRL